MTLITPLPASPTLTRLTAIFTTCGLVRSLPESKFNAATALAGSGPAFVAVMVDALADGGVLMGLTRQEATEMAAQSTSPGFDGFRFDVDLEGSNERHRANDPRYAPPPITPQRRRYQ